MPQARTHARAHARKQREPAAGKELGRRDRAGERNTRAQGKGNFDHRDMETSGVWQPAGVSDDEAVGRRGHGFPGVESQESLVHVQADRRLLFHIHVSCHVRDSAKETQEKSSNFPSVEVSDLEHVRGGGDRNVVELRGASSSGQVQTHQRRSHESLQINGARVCVLRSVRSLWR